MIPHCGGNSICTEDDIVAALDKAAGELFEFENSIKEKWSNGYHDTDG